MVVQLAFYGSSLPSPRTVGRPPNDDESSVLDEWAELKAAIKAEAGLHSLKSHEFWARMLIHYVVTT